MEMTVNIKAIGERYGTVGWLKRQIENGDILLEESNNFYIPYWSGGFTPCGIKTHGLVMRDKERKHSALIAYRKESGEYAYNVSAPLSDDEYAHWTLNLTDAARDVLRGICEQWCEKQEELQEEMEAIEVPV